MGICERAGGDGRQYRGDDGEELHFGLGGSGWCLVGCPNRGI